MSTLVGLIEFLLACGTLVIITFLVTLALPESPTRRFAVQCAGWLVAAFAGLYVVIPCDLAPEILLGPAGCFDDLAVGIFGIAAAYAARKAGQGTKEVTERLSESLKTRHQSGRRSARGSQTTSAK